MYDFIIIGGGIIGMSTAMQLIRTYPNRKMLLVEKEPGPAHHQTGHNSGVIHAGVYYTPGSLKARFCLEGNRATKDFCDTHDIAYDECGKLLVATNDLEVERMKALWKRTAANGLQREWLSAPQLKVLGLEERATEAVVKTSQGDFASRYLISCSGLMADRIVRMLGLDPGFTICPFRGEYFVLPEKYNGIVNHLIYPIPDPSMPFLGVHLTRMIDGTVTVGPNAVLALKREGYQKSDISFADIIGMFTNPGILKVLKDNLKPGLREMKNSLFKDGYLREVQKYCPILKKEDLGEYPAGVRAQAVSKDGKLVDDFLFVNTKRTVNVCNAPSPAATSAIPIGAYIVETVKDRIA